MNPAAPTNIPRRDVPMSSVFYAASDAAAPAFIDKDKWENLSPDRKAQEAWHRYSGGDLRPEVVMYVEAGIPGANRDGVLDENELKTLKNLQDDKAFMSGLTAVAATGATIVAASALAEYVGPRSIASFFDTLAHGVVPETPEAPPARQVSPVMRMLDTLTQRLLLGPQPPSVD